MGGTTDQALDAVDRQPLPLLKSPQILMHGPTRPMKRPSLARASSGWQGLVDIPAFRLVCIMLGPVAADSQAGAQGIRSKKYERQATGRRPQPFRPAPSSTFPDTKPSVATSARKTHQDCANDRGRETRNPRI